MRSKPEQPPNAPGPIVVSLLGSWTNLSAAQLLNAESLISVMRVGIIIWPVSRFEEADIVSVNSKVLRAVQLLKHSDGITVSFAGSEMLSMLLQE